MTDTLEMPMWFWIVTTAALSGMFGYGLRGLIAQIRGENFRDL